MSFQASALLLAWAAIVLLALALTGLIRQLRYLTMSLEGGRTGVVGASPERARSGLAAAAGSRPPGIEDLLSTHGSPLGIVFASDACRSCEARLDELRQVVNGADRLIVIRRRPAEAPAAGTSRAGFPEVHGPGLFDAFGVTVTPTAFAVGDDGSIVDSVFLSSKTAVEQFTTMMKEL